MKKLPLRDDFREKPVTCGGDERLKGQINRIRNPKELKQYIMRELMIVANVAIVFGVIYKLFELFAGKQERMLFLEKMGDKLPPEALRKGIIYRPNLFSFNSLRAGSLLLGLGLGLIVSYAVVCLTLPQYYQFEYVGRMKDAVSVIYGAGILLGGGAGLVVSYLIERRQSQKLD